MATLLASRTSLPLDRTSVERFGHRRGEAEWLIGTRLAAADRYLAPAAWPTGLEEEWRRFPLEALPSGPLLGAVSATAYAGTVAPGVIFGSLAESAATHADLVAPWLSHDEGIGTHIAFRALVGALWSDGSFLHVPAETAVQGPLWIRRHWAAGDAALLERTILVLERGASVTVVEELTSEDGGPGRIAVPHLEVHLGAGARLRYIGIRRLGADVWDLGFQRFASGRDSDLAAFDVLVGGRRSKIGVDSDIRGDGAQVRLYGLLAAGDEQRIDVNTFQKVDGRASSSDVLFLSALYDAAHAVTYGVIRVEPSSKGTGSYQEFRSMLLSDKAGADPIPVLEILTNDVTRCGHAATAGSIDENELFYVMSRGFDRRGAEELLVRGFFQRVLDRLEDESVRQRALHALAPRIGQDPTA